MAFFSSLLCNIIANYWSRLRVAKEERSRKLILIIWCGFTGGTLIAFNSSGHLLLLPSWSTSHTHGTAAELCFCTGKENGEQNEVLLWLQWALTVGTWLPCYLLFLDQVMKIDSSSLEVSNIKAEITWSCGFGMSHTSLFWDYHP